MCEETRCHSYTAHLVAEHRRLHALLRQMRTTVNESVLPDEEPTFAHVVRVLQKLHAELKQHFAEEEAGGCLEEAVSYCPGLAGEEKRIEAEHAQILAAIEQLIQQSSSLPANHQNQLAIQQSFARLYRQIHAHEAAENRLLAQGFGMPVNGGEQDEPTSVLDF